MALFLWVNCLKHFTILKYQDICQKNTQNEPNLVTLPDGSHLYLAYGLFCSVAQSPLQKTRNMLHWNFWFLIFLCCLNTCVKFKRACTAPGCGRVRWRSGSAGCSRRPARPERWSSGRWRRWRRTPRRCGWRISAGCVCRWWCAWPRLCSSPAGPRSHDLWARESWSPPHRRYLNQWWWVQISNDWCRWQTSHF